MGKLKDSIMLPSIVKAQFYHLSLLCHLRALILVEEYPSHPHLQGNEEELHGKTPKS